MGERVEDRPQQGRVGQGQDAISADDLTLTAAPSPGGAASGAQRARPSSEFSGRTLAHFEMLELVGAGGFGEVYRARDTRLDRIVAIKILPQAFAVDAERRERFRREAIAASALNHPHICTVHELVEADGHFLIVMELVEGQTLHERLKAGPLPVAEALPIAIQIADALGRGAPGGDPPPGREVPEHRADEAGAGEGARLRPGEAPRVRDAAGRADAGEADGGRDVAGDAGVHVARAASRQAARPAERSFLIRRRPLPDGDRAAAVRGNVEPSRWRTRSCTPSRTSSATGPIPEKLKEIVRKLLQKDPEKRYASAEEVEAELKALEAELSPARRAGLSRTAWAAVAAGLVVVVSVGGWYAHRWSRERWALQGHGRDHAARGGGGVHEGGGADTGGPRDPPEGPDAREALDEGDGGGERRDRLPRSARCPCARTRATPTCGRASGRPR